MKAVLRKEFQDALRNRWLLVYALALAVLGLMAAAMGAGSSAGLGLQMFGRTTATLMNLCLLLAPLMAISMGALSIAGERDRGTLEQLLAQPLERWELVAGKYGGLLFSLAAATLAGFAPAGIWVAIVAGLPAFAHYLLFPLLAVVLVAAMLGLGILVSVCSSGGARAQSTGLFLWFFFVLFYDLLLMGTLVLSGISTTVLAVLLVVNPVNAARVLTILILEPDLYLLGPAGAFLVTQLSVAGTAAVLLAVLLLWGVLPPLLAIWLFRLRRARATPHSTRHELKLSNPDPLFSPVVSGCAREFGKAKYKQKVAGL